MKIFFLMMLLTVSFLSPVFAENCPGGQTWHEDEGRCIEDRADVRSYSGIGTGGYDSTGATTGTDLDSITRRDF
jgi:hypothetical protein